MGGAVGLVMRGFAVGVVLLALLAPRVAFADDAATVPKKKAWYGWETLVLDAAAVSMVIGSMRASPGWDQTKPTPLGAAGVAVYVVGPPIVHVVNARPKMAALDFGLRVLTSAAMFTTIYAIDNDHSNGWFPPEIMLVPIVVSAVFGLIATDSAAMAWKPATD